MGRIIREARPTDMAEIMKVMDAAKGIMRHSGNMHQWSDGYPSEAVITADMERNGGFVIEDSGCIVGYFAFLPSPEPTYSKIYDGEWLDDTLPYHVVHRIASYPDAHGIFSSIMDFCFLHDTNIRIDTHHDNKIMQHNILKHGFTYCGIIYLLSGDARLAYQKKVKVNMTTLDLRMELAQEIQNIPDSEQLLTRAIDFVRNLTKHEDFSIVLTGDALRLWNRTAELSVLNKGWDGASAMPIEKKAVQNMQRLIKAGTSEDFKDWVLFPDDNGTLLMQSKDGMASISIGNSSFSFVYTKGDKVNAGENIRFSALKVLKTLRDIALSAK